VRPSNFQSRPVFPFHIKTFFFVHSNKLNKMILHQWKAAQPLESVY